MAAGITAGRIRHCFVGALVASGVVAMAAGTAQAADTAVGVRVGHHGVLQAGILVKVPVGISCPADAPGTTLGQTGLTLKQARGRTIATADLGIRAGSVTCDGAWHWYTAVGTADADHAPFTTGAAVMAVSYVSVCDPGLLDCLVGDQRPVVVTLARPA